MMLLLKTQVFENAQPESADLSKVQVPDSRKQFSNALLK
jgi:hypothetical protein